MKSDSVTINSRKFDGRIHRSWKASLVKRDGSLLLFVGKFEREVNHPDLGVIKCGTISYEHYWLDRWYNIFRFHEPDGEFRNFYCNISMPTKFEDNAVDYVDMDIDVLVNRDLTYLVLDRAEFEENIVKYQYPDETIRMARSSLKELLILIRSGEFPFNIDSQSR